MFDNGHRLPANPMSKLISPQRIQLFQNPVSELMWNGLIKHLKKMLIAF